LDAALPGKKTHTYNLGLREKTRIDHPTSEKQLKLGKGYIQKCRGTGKELKVFERQETVADQWKRILDMQLVWGHNLRKEKRPSTFKVFGA